MTGIDMIAQERKEQIEKHGFTVEHDAEHNVSAHLHYAATMILHDNPKERIDYKPFGWDSAKWEKMCKKPYKQRIVIAGALLAAEYDRLSFEDEEKIK